MTIEDDDLEWELDRGVPQFGDPFIQKYLDGRDALIEQEKKRRHDFTFKKSMSAVVAEACRIVSHIRSKELRTIWTQSLGEGEYGEPPQPDEVLFPGVMFTVAKERMEKTNLWKIVQKMPKGSLLHAHIDAMFDADFLIEQALSTSGMHIASSQPILSEEDFEEATLSFHFFNKSPVESGDEKNIWSEAYPPSTFIPIQTAAASFPRGGELGFRTSLKKRIMLSPEHSYQHHHGIDAIWKIFSRCFTVIRDLLHYEPIYRACLRRLLGQLAQDGIRYIDFRAAFVFPYYCEGNEQPEKDYLEYFRAFKEEIDKFKQTEEGRDFYGARMIWTTIRSFSNRRIIENMEQCIQAKIAYPEMICGYDLVGQEDLGRSLIDLVPLLFWFRKRCAEEKLEIPFFFHAGECLGDGNDTDNNLFDAILLGTRRIGHGFSLFKHPLLIDLVKEKKIMIECCPISNEILRLTPSIQSHPLPALLARGVSVSLCNDDPAILGHGKNGLTHDFWQALQGLDNMGLEGLATMAENSIRWSAFEDQSQATWLNDIRKGIAGGGVKAKRLEEWYADFEKFCQWVVMEFAGEVDDDEEDLYDSRNFEELTEGGQTSRS